jgi:GrpB-like predicted nucleotidyltransferase (UPF0157 family)
MSLDESVDVVAYDARWPLRFGAEAELLRSGLKGGALAIEHIGSTSVVGLAAKPVIDIMVGVSDLATTAPLTAALVALNYEALGEAGVPGRLYFRKRAAHSFNVHVMRHAGELWEANILLRDFLRAHAAEAAAYAAVKRAAARETPTLLAYSERKAPFITALLERAQRWRANTAT